MSTRRDLAPVVFAVVLWACPALGKVVISEFRTRGPAGGNDEFIELYNASTEAVEIGGYKVKASNATGGVGVRATIPAGTVMGPRTFYLLVNTASGGYSGVVPGDLTYSVGIMDNGGLALTNAAGVVLDAVGLSVGSAFQEGTPLPAFSSINKEQSYERKTASCGPDQDTDDNASDFRYNDGVSYPQNSASCRLACAGDLCVSPPDPFCEDPGMSVVFTTWACEGGQCTYYFEEVLCEYGCDALTGLCRPDPCEGVVCETPPNRDCYEGSGRCLDGVCKYEPLAVGSECDDLDLCTEFDACDALHKCVGVPKVCTAPAPVCADLDTSRLVLDLACDPQDGACRGTMLEVNCLGLGCDDTFGTCNQLPVISQFRTRGPRGGNDEFVEIFNPSALAVDIGGWTLRGSNGTGTTTVRATVPVGTVMAPRTFFLFVNTRTDGYSGTVPGDVGYSAGIADDGGLALVDAFGFVVDAVGMSGGSAYLEGTPLAQTLANQDQAYERKSIACGPDRDLGNNASDFTFMTSSRPRNRLSCRPECAGDLCVMPPSPWCEDAVTLNAYPAGECVSGGVCAYPVVQVRCDFGCEAGACKPDPCDGVVCDDAPNAQCYEETGMCLDGECVYWRLPTGTTCDDGNECTILDSCDQKGECVGVSVVCPVMAPECLDDNTSRSYSAGTCDPTSGECSYEPRDTLCAFFCDEDTGLCLGDPCAGVTCDDPPSACHASVGTCFGGRCEYAPLSDGTRCDDEDPCTLDDQCDGEGGCAGMPLECSSPQGPCYEPNGTCEDGTCVYLTLAQGTPCDDEDPCTLDDQCDGEGRCTGTPNPDCALPPDGGEDAATGCEGGWPDVAGVDDKGFPSEEAELAQADGTPGEDAIALPEVGVDRPGLDTGTDTSPRKGGGGRCSAVTEDGPFVPGWLALSLIAASLFLFRRRSRQAPRS